MNALSENEIQSALKDLTGWTFEDNKLNKTFTFNNFQEAVGFIVRIAFPAEQLDHHPELFNVYNRVEIALTTHDAGNRVTQKDLNLAQHIERIAG